MSAAPPPALAQKLSVGGGMRPCSSSQPRSDPPATMVQAMLPLGLVKDNGRAGSALAEPRWTSASSQLCGGGHRRVGVGVGVGVAVT